MATKRSAAAMAESHSNTGSSQKSASGLAKKTNPRRSGTKSLAAGKPAAIAKRPAGRTKKSAASAEPNAQQDSREPLSRSRMQETASSIAPRWTFLTNHAHVLILLSQDPSMVLREVAGRIGITERAVQRIIADLEEDGFIQREKIGRNNHYRIQDKRPLRHPIEAHRSIGDLVNLILASAG